VSVVVVTGAGQGQGAAEARLLAARGTTVIAADLTEAPAEDLPGVDYRQLDVTDQVGWTGLAKELAERYGRVHCLVANAGVTWRARLLDVTPADLHRVYEVNVTGALLAVQAIAPLLTAGGRRRHDRPWRRQIHQRRGARVRRDQLCLSTFPATTSGISESSPPSTAAA
jgi:NAD(P)-dependent dehydrogenase (short-subunit alcohol dehydrogenase family)